MQGCGLMDCEEFEFYSVSFLIFLLLINVVQIQMNTSYSFMQIISYGDCNFIIHYTCIKLHNKSLYNTQMRFLLSSNPCDLNVIHLEYIKWLQDEYACFMSAQ